MTGLLKCEEEQKRHCVGVSHKDRKDVERGSRAIQSMPPEFLYSWPQCSILANVFNSRKMVVVSSSSSSSSSSCSGYGIGLTQQKGSIQR